MATVNFYESSLSDISKSKKARKGTVIKNIVESFINNKEEIQTIEVYFPDEDKTEYIPIENDTYNVLVIANGEEVSLDYKVKADDIISIYVLQRDNETGATILGWVGVGLAVVAAIALIAISAGVGGLAGAQLLMAVGSSLSLFGTGVALAISGFNAAELYRKQKNNDGSSETIGEKKNLYSVNGGNNEPIIDHNYPLTLGKHLINPYMIGSPYHTTFNRSPERNITFEGWSHHVLGFGTSISREPVKYSYTNLSIDHKDDGQYYQALYCAGYGPLKLTDFRIGDTKLAYNRPANTGGMDTLINDILNLQEGGSVDLLNRPIVPASELNKKGWNIEENSYCTIYTSAYFSSDDKYALVVTPIIIDKLTGELVKILTPTELGTEAKKILGTVVRSGERATYTDTLGIGVGKAFYNISGIDSLVKTVEKFKVQCHELSDLYTKKTVAGTLMHGILSGTDATYDCGDILNKWKNNDIQLEIIQGGDSLLSDNKYSALYPVTVKEDEINAPLLFAHDKSIVDNDSKEVLYKGVAIPCGYRTNTVRFSKSCPYRIEVELDMPQGLYATYTKTDDSSNTKVYFKQIPVNIAVQWRYASSDEKSSDAESPEGWNSFDYELLMGQDGYTKKEPVNYIAQTALYEIKKNKGLSSDTLPDNNANWKNGSKVFELSTGLCNISGDKYFEWESTAFDTYDKIKALKDEGIIDIDFVTKVDVYRVVTEQKYVGRKRDPNSKNFWERAMGVPVYETVYKYLSGAPLTKTTGMFNCKYHSAASNLMTHFEYYHVSKGPRWDDTLYRLNYTTTPKYYNEVGWELDSEFVSSVDKKKFKESADISYIKDRYNINERRFVFVKEFTPEECQKLITKAGVKSDYFDQIEVRAIRITPCYINQTESGNKYISGESYEDLVKWTYLRTWVFDKDRYTEAVDNAIKNNVSLSTIKPADYAERPIPEEDLNKFCYIALRLKQDVAETGGQSLEKLNCIATSLQPKYDMFDHKWSPYVDDEGNVKEITLNKKKDYFVKWTDCNDKKVYVKLPVTERDKDVIKVDIYNKVGFSNISGDEKYSPEKQYQYILTTEYADLAFYKNAGNDYYDQIRSNFFNDKMYDEPIYAYPENASVLMTNSPRCFLDKKVENAFNTQNSASAAIYSLIGNHLKNEAKTLDCVDLARFGEMYEFCNDVTDGSLQTYKSPSLPYHSYTTYLNNKLASFINKYKNSALKEMLSILSKAPVNAVWSGCYDYVIDKIIAMNNYSEYFKSDIIKYLENNNYLAAPDGQLHIQYNCNGAISQQIKLESLFQQIMATGRSSYRRSGENKYEPVIGRAGEYPVTIINQRNCISKSNSKNFEEGISGFNVTYVDENDNYETNNMYVMDDGESEKCPTKRIEQFKLPFVTNARQMRSLTRFNLACLLYQKEAYSRTIGKIGYALQLGDVVLLQDDTLLVGTDKSGRIQRLLYNETGTDPLLIGFITDEPFEFKNEINNNGESAFGCSVVQPNKYGQSRCVTIRSAIAGASAINAIKAVEYDSNKVYYILINDSFIEADPQPENDEDLQLNTYFTDVETFSMKEGLTNVFLFSTPINNNEAVIEDVEKEGVYYECSPQEGNLIAYGKVGSITLKAVIMSIKPKDKGQFDLSLVPYNETLYSYGEKIPEFRNNMTTPQRDGMDYNFQEFATTADREADKAESINKTSAMIDTVFQVTKTPDPFTLVPVARRDYITFNFSHTEGPYNDISKYYCDILKPERVTGVETSEGMKYYDANSSEVEVIYKVEKIPGTEDQYYNWTTKGHAEFSSKTYNYYFNRGTDGYPEAEVLSQWVIKATCKNTFGVLSDAQYVSVSTSMYGTWQLNNLTEDTVNIKVNDRVVNMQFAVPSGTKETYGNIQYKVSIKRIRITGNDINDAAPKGDKVPVVTPDEIWYKPNLKSDPYGEDTNYKDVTSSKNYIESGSSYTQILPLAGQYSDEERICNTVYQFMIVAYNEAGSTDEYVTGLVVAMCTSLRDIVKAHADYKDLYVEKLSAITANVGLISQGGFGSFEDMENYWALSDLSAADTGITNGVKKGAFRVGDKDEYLQVEPYNGDDGKKHFKISLKAGNITLTSDNGATFDSGTYVYNNEKDKRMSLSYDGITVEQLNGSTWEKKAKIYINDTGNLIIANSDTDDAELPVNGIEINPNVSTIFHMDGDTSAIGSKSDAFNFDGKFVAQSGTVSGSTHVFMGKITNVLENQDVCLFNNANYMRVGKDLIDIENLRLKDEVSYWNQTLGTTVFKWEEK